MEKTVNCEQDCRNGCILGDQCPNKEYAQRANEFMQTTSLDRMHEIAEAARLKKLSEPPKWIIPDDF
ncbi:MAG: hypothetical protein F6J87_04595 [Spirulina sp. SIO3F2]|nr:hypothetical protein [Spirulina sp. SIO3F2]